MDQTDGAKNPRGDIIKLDKPKHRRLDNSDAPGPQRLSSEGSLSISRLKNTKPSQKKQHRSATKLAADVSLSRDEVDSLSDDQPHQKGSSWAHDEADLVEMIVPVSGLDEL